MLCLSPVPHREAGGCCARHRGAGDAELNAAECRRTNCEFTFMVLVITSFLRCGILLNILSAYWASFLWWFAHLCFGPGRVQYAQSRSVELSRTALMALGVLLQRQSPPAGLAARYSLSAVSTVNRRGDRTGSSASSDGGRLASSYTTNYAHSFINKISHDLRKISTK